MEHDLILYIRNVFLLSPFPSSLSHEPDFSSGFCPSLSTSHLCFPHPYTHFVFAPLKSYHVSFLYGSLFGPPPPSIHHEAQTVTQAMTTWLSLTNCLIVQAKLPVLQECQAPAVIHRTNFKSSFKVFPVRFLFWSLALVFHLW